MLGRLFLPHHDIDKLGGNHSHLHDLPASDCHSHFLGLEVNDTVPVTTFEMFVAWITATICFPAVARLIFSSERMRSLSNSSDAPEGTTITLRSLPST